ncbi:lantibiotic immunity ABC transporter MutE/EpiE family permease subunit [Paenibacillus sp. P46E]|uniref:lantibiotic immunity ABC transporter MutE/EpiE family permease subunit n=1 Tax=Paenibacillus sp. P46E TaxID=1349436 RepID=UPI0009400708|nr:lantibiotic immunity ABC transporter MutE/EpiE family permease subunit [Paenibacillus sp. P46E]OKP98270.1 multidrug ABC transporter permease [Paenibacillus sp. P46E]
MFSILQSEHLKYKRSFSLKLVWAAPSFFVLFALIALLYIPKGQSLPGELFLSMVFNWWPFIFVPLGTALLCALAEVRERKAGHYRGLRLHNIRPGLLWIGKIMVLAYYMLLSSLGTIAAALLAGLLITDGTLPVEKVVYASLLTWLVSLSLIPLQLMAAAWKGMAASIGLGVAGMFAGVLAAPGPHWLYVPWSWALRLMCPVAGVHPNGVPLETGDPLLDTSVIPAGIAVSLLFFAASSWLTGVWFDRKEVK